MNISLALSQIFTGAAASLSNRWQFCSFLDKALFAQSTVTPKYWPGYGNALDLPGLPVDQTLVLNGSTIDKGPVRWDGIISYQGHVMGFQGSTLTWSDVNDFTNYIPVSNTIQDIALTLADNFTQILPETVSGWVFFNESTVGIVPDMYVRLDYPPYYNFYTVVAVSLVSGVKSNSEGFSQLVRANSSAIIFVDSQVAWATPKAATTGSDAQIGFVGTAVGGAQATGNLNQTQNVSGIAYVGTVNTTGTAEIGSRVITNLNTTDGIAIGMAVSGAGIPLGTTVTAVQSGGSTAYLSASPTVSGGVTLTFTSISGIEVGSVVSGFGIQAGTTALDYDSALGTLQLSSPSTITETGVTLTFAPLNQSTPLQILDASTSQSSSQIINGFGAPAIGQSITLQFYTIPWAAGDYVSFGDSEISGLDIYQVQSVTAGTSEYISNATSSLTSATVTSTATSLPASLAVGSIMLGQVVSSISGSSGSYTITLSGFADIAISDGIIYYTALASAVFTRLGLGIDQNFAYPANTYVVTQPYLEVFNNTNAGVSIPAFSQIGERYGLKLSLLNLTGAAPVGSTFIGGTQVLSLNANEAGQLVNAGDRVNGPIWAMSTSGLYAVIMKERSFQSIQYVGSPQIFNIWPEFTDEGLLGRNTWCKVGENTIYFWGHRAFFQFASGSGDATPIGQKQFVQVLAEIDLTRISEACMYHKEDRREVWFVFPVQGYDPNVGPSRVFVYNYEQSSISIDDYADLGDRITEDSRYTRVTNDGSIRVLESVSAQSPITAVGSLPVYTTALVWQDWTGEWRDQLVAWSELTGGRQFVTLMGLYPGGEVQLASHGGVYDRNGEAIYSEWETVQHDGGDEEAFKYVDLIQFSLAVDNIQEFRPFRLYVQIGVKPNFDSAITWSTPQWIDCAGNAEYVTKKNFNMSGRFIVAKWWSDQADCQWRIASYTISGRLGGTY